MKITIKILVDGEAILLHTLNGSIFILYYNINNDVPTVQGGKTENDVPI